MPYRMLGRTGVQVGIIGLGCEHLVDLSRQQIEAVVAAAVLPVMRASADDAGPRPAASASGSTEGDTTPRCAT